MMSQPSPRRDARYATRLDVALTAQLRRRGSSGKFAVKVIDLSMTGFRCETASLLPIGQAVSLALPGFAPREAEVAWNSGSLYGCAFINALHVAVFDHICARHRARD